MMVQIDTIFREMLYLLFRYSKVYRERMMIHKKQY